MIVFFLVIIINKFFIEVPFYGPFYLYYLSTLLLTMYQRVARSFGLSREFAVSGVINVLVLIISQTIALTLLDAKIIGFIYTYVIANFLTVIYLEFKTLSIKKFTLKEYDLKLIKELINFGLPLVPNNISWLSVATINKIIIVSYLGLGWIFGLGCYSVSVVIFLYFPLCFFVVFFCKFQVYQYWLVLV